MGHEHNSLENLEEKVKETAVEALYWPEAMIVYLNNLKSCDSIKFMGVDCSMWCTLSGCESAYIAGHYRANQ